MKDRPRKQSPKTLSAEASSDSATELTQTERRIAKERTAPRAAVIHEAIRAEGESELQRPVSALTWSGLAAGLSIGFSLVASGLIRSQLADTNWRPLIANFGYSVGFLTVILGRQQLYTENTLTVMLPLLTLRDLATLMHAPSLGRRADRKSGGRVRVCFCARQLRHLQARGEQRVFRYCQRRSIGRMERIDDPRNRRGWLIALMVWMMPGADSSRAFIIVVMTYLVALGGLPHGIAGSVDGFFLVARGTMSWGGMLGNYLIPVLIGNTIGGVSLVAFFNHAQVVTETRPLSRVND